MSDYISIHVHGQIEANVRRAVTEVFQAQGFALSGDEAAPVVVDDEDTLPEGEDWYGVLVSGASRDGWVSVYVDDWQDSGVLAQGVSQRLAAPVLEVWVAEDTFWGYTFYLDGQVTDRFADDPGKVADTPAEAEALTGNAETLTPILRASAAEFAQVLQDARANAGQFVGTAMDALGAATGLPFEHLMIGYEAFFEDDPEDYGPGLNQWPQWRHLAFTHPEGAENLSPSQNIPA